ncbi:MAG: acyl-CoA thioesterase [Bdellovibrio sp.]|nr:MAG: acyl-CoA thioesterase [Bdellovibrio sp.]
MKSFTHFFKVHFDNCDSAGVSFYGRLFFYIHRCLEDFWEQSPLGWHIWFDHKDWVVPIVETKAQYKHFMKPPLLYKIVLHVKQFTRSTVTFSYQIYQEDTLCATASTTHVFVSTKTQKATRVPKQIFDYLTLFKETDVAE